MKHTCHWPKCEIETPPRLHMCRHHWFKVPKEMRDELKKHYKPEQCKTKRPSREYLNAALAIRRWINEAP